MLVLFPRIIAIGIAMRTLIGRNEASRTLAALRNIHLPERLIMIVAVIFRFFPVLSGDMKLLRQSTAAVSRSSAAYTENTRLLSDVEMTTMTASQKISFVIG